MYDISLKISHPRVIANLLYYHPVETVTAIGIDAENFTGYPYLVRKAFLWSAPKVLKSDDITKMIANLITKEKSAVLLERCFNSIWMPVADIEKAMATMTFEQVKNAVLKMWHYPRITINYIKYCPEDYLPGLLGAIDGPYTKRPAKGCDGLIPDYYKEDLKQVIESRFNKEVA